MKNLKFKIKNACPTADRKNYNPKFKFIKGVFKYEYNR